MTINDAVGGFLFHCQYERNLNKKTLCAYKNDLSQFLRFIKEKFVVQNISEINRDIIKAYLQQISAFKPKTIKRKIASLKAMFNYLEYENDDYMSPFRKIKVRIKEPFTLPTVMTIDEVKRIFSVVYSRLSYKNKTSYAYKAQIRNVAIIELLFATGIRVSELCNLKSNDIDLQSGIVKVYGKGSKERVIQICQIETLDILKKYYSIFQNEIERNSSFFVNRLGASVSTQSVRLMVKKILIESGINKKVTPHTFRHTFATLLLEEDVDIKYIQNLLGHSSISTTQIYTHVNTAKQKNILSLKHPRRNFSFSI